MRDLASVQAVTRVNVEQASKITVVDADPPEIRGRPSLRVKRASRAARKSTGVVTTACTHGRTAETREPPTTVGSDRQPETREGKAGSCGVAERAVVPCKPGNAGGGKGPYFGVLPKKKRRGDWR